MPGFELFGEEEKKQVKSYELMYKTNTTAK